MVTPYLAGVVNHATIVMKWRRLLTINLAHVHAQGWRLWRRAQYCDRRNRELWLEERAHERLQSAPTHIRDQLMPIPYCLYRISHS